MASTSAPDQAVPDHIDGRARLFQCEVAEERIVLTVTRLQRHEDDLADDRSKAFDLDRHRAAHLAGDHALVGGFELLGTNDRE
ncbi:MAG: hypothetical protein ABIR79_16715 [Candidatus Binatia bacterium]